MVGPFSGAFRRAFRSFGARVRFAGILEPTALGAVLAEAAVLVHPAVGESFGLAPFEAALGGAAPVVTAGHGCGAALAAAGGRTVPADDADALASAVGARLDDPALASREAAAVASFASRELTWERAARALERVYEAIRA